MSPWPQRPGRACTSPARCPRAQLDDQSLEQHPRLAGRALEVEVRPKQRVDGAAQPRPADRELRPHQPARAGRGSSRAAHQHPASGRAVAARRRRRRPRWRWSSPSRPAAPPARPSAAHVVERDRLLPERVEQQPLDVVAQPLHVGAGTLRQQPRRGRIDLRSRAATRLLTHRSASAWSSSTPHSTSVACFAEQLVHPAALVERRRPRSTSVVCGSGRFEQRLRARRARAPPRRSRASARAARRPEGRAPRAAAPSSAASGRPRRATPPCPPAGRRS